MTDEFEHFEQLDRICWETRFGIVQGVEIDLRHPDIDPSIWSPTWAFGGTGTSALSMEGPWLTFPWTDSWDRKRSSLRRGRPCKVEVGDKIVIENVERCVVGSDMDHPADREARAAYLVIRRGSGRRIRPAQPVVFWHHLSLQRPGHIGRPTFSRIVGRICHAMGVAQLDDFDLIEEGGLTLYEAAFGAAKDVRLEARMHLESLADPDRDFPRDPAASVHRMIDLAMALGYRAAQAEAEEFMAGPAHKSRRLVMASSEGGRRGAETRSRRADLWRNRARQIIREILLQPGTHSRDTVAHEVEAIWDWPDQRCPSVASLKVLIREMEFQGEVSFP